MGVGKMDSCNICGKSDVANISNDSTIYICRNCSFRITVIGQSLTECLELMQDIFNYCPQPSELRRVFVFIGKQMDRLFSGIASAGTRKNIWKIITNAYTGKSCNLASKDFFDHPEYLEKIKQGISGDTYLLKIFKERIFKFDLSQEPEEFIEPLSASGSGVWSIGEQLVLESLEIPYDSDDEDMIV